jgi:hypothetical protein
MASASKCMVHCTLGTIYLPTTLIVNEVALSKQSIKLKNFKKKVSFCNDGGSTRKDANRFFDDFQFRFAIIQNCCKEWDYS